MAWVQIRNIFSMVAAVAALLLLSAVASLADERTEIHSKTNAMQAQLVGIPANLEKAEFEPCPDCAPVLLACQNWALEKPSDVSFLKIAVMDWPTAQSGDWLEENGATVVVLPPEEMLAMFQLEIVDCAAFGGGELRFDADDAKQTVSELVSYLDEKGIKDYTIIDNCSVFEEWLAACF